MSDKEQIEKQVKEEKTICPKCHRIRTILIKVNGKWMCGSCAEKVR